MDDLQKSSDSEAGCPLYSIRMEPDTPDSLNNACLLNDSDYLFEDPQLPHEFSSTFVPETPRYYFICKYHININYLYVWHVIDKSLIHINESKELNFTAHWFTEENDTPKKMTTKVW